MGLEFTALLEHKYRKKSSGKSHSIHKKLSGDPKVDESYVKDSWDRWHILRSLMVTKEQHGF